MARVDQAEKVGEAKRCGFCENCKKAGPILRTSMAEMNGIPYSLWLRVNMEFPCLAYAGCDGAGPHQDGPTYKFKLHGLNDDNVYILCRACWERMEKEHMEEEVVTKQMMRDAMDAEDAFGADELEAHAAKLRKKGG